MSQKLFSQGYKTNSQSMELKQNGKSKENDGSIPLLLHKEQQTTFPVVSVLPRTDCTDLEALGNISSYNRGVCQLHWCPIWQAENNVKSKWSVIYIWYQQSRKKHAVKEICIVTDRTYLSTASVKISSSSTVPYESYVSSITEIMAIVLASMIRAREYWGSWYTPNVQK